MQVHVGQHQSAGQAEGVRGKCGNVGKSCYRKERVRQANQASGGWVSLHTLSELKGDVGLDVGVVPSGCRGCPQSSGTWPTVTQAEE